MKIIKSKTVRLITLSIFILISILSICNFPRKHFAIGQEAIPFMLKDSELIIDTEHPIPKAEIGGIENQYNIGDLIDLWVKPTQKPKDMISVNYTWTILPEVPLKIWPDKTRVLFGTGPTDTTFIVVLNASYVFANKTEDGKIDSVTQYSSVTMASIVVGKNEDQPVKPDEPAKPAEPDNPSLTGLSRMAYEWVAQVDRTNYSEIEIKADAAKLADSFRDIVTLIDNGTLISIGAILNQTKENNDATITNRNEWLPWFTKMSTFLQSSYSNGSIKTIAQFKQAWIDIANGLDEYSK